MMIFVSLSKHKCSRIFNTNQQIKKNEISNVLNLNYLFKKGSAASNNLAVPHLISCFPTFYILAGSLLYVVLFIFFSSVFQSHKRYHDHFSP